MAPNSLINKLKHNENIIQAAFFERNDLSEVDDKEEEFQHAHVQIVNNPQGVGKVVKCSIQPLDKRAEIKMYRDPVNSERWYGWELYLEENWQRTSAHNIITQWHRWQGGMENAKYKWAKGKPMYIGIDDDDEYVVQIAYQIEPNNPNSRVFIREKLGINIKEDKGRWVHWAAHVRWSPENDGYFHLYKEGKIVYKRVGANWLNLPLGPYFKAGIYTGSPEWVGPVQCNIYVDNVIIGDENASLKEVSPGIN